MKSKLKGVLGAAAVLALAFASNTTWAQNLTASGTGPTVVFDDTNASPEDGWRISGDDGDSGNLFEIQDDFTSNEIFRIESGAPDNSIYVDSTGAIGLGTNAPLQAIHGISGKSGLAMRLQSNNDTWDVGVSQSDTGDFSVGLIAGGNNGIPFNIDDSTGNVGVWENNADTALEIGPPAGSDAGLHVNNTGGNSSSNLNLLTLEHPAAAPFQRYISAFGTWDFSAGNFFVINDPADAAIEFRQEKDGDLTIGGTLTQNSSRAAKHGIEPVNAREVLDKVAGLPIQHWTYIDDREQARHMGPMAEDFSEAFGLGATDKGISTLDSNGVALASIQALKVENDALKAEVAELREMVQSLAAKRQVAKNE